MQANYVTCFIKMSTGIMAEEHSVLFFTLGSSEVNGGKMLQLSGLGYEEMAGTYKCIVKGVGGQNSGSGTLEVYCKYYTDLL